MFFHAKLTRVTVSKIIKSFELKDPLNIVSNDIKKVKIPKTLYINMDETFVKLRKNKKLRKYRIRLVTFHAG
ncbi:hypothetical protein [Spiroplasma attinicola]|uniref:hypothetical protein n=1 Tax=Spiroplasma attinicola TaxID=2904537 RepID=UPI002022A5FA|nr:hypothetical protein [Spiroplasma sp. JKS002670]MCL8209905.1 hypothetical protein [Spiroplasma sp. JKS002670]